MQLLQDLLHAACQSPNSYHWWCGLPVANSASLRCTIILIQCCDHKAFCNKVLKLRLPPWQAGLLFREHPAPSIGAAGSGQTRHVRVAIHPVFR